MSDERTDTSFTDQHVPSAFHPTFASAAPVDEEQAKEYTKKAGDLDVVRKSVDDASTFVRGLWVTFVTLGTYLMIAAGSVTHRQLFLENPIRLPLLDVTLPLVGFFIIAPAFFLVFHAYLLLQIGLLSDKVARYNEILYGAGLGSGVRRDLRRQLPNDVLVQFLAGPREKREGAIGLTLRMIAWITMVLGPLTVLLFIQLRFLPYQDELVTWLQRLCVVLDIAAIWLLWQSVTSRQLKTYLPRWSKVTAGSALCGMVVAVSCFALTFPGEWIDDVFPAKAFHDLAVWPMVPISSDQDVVSPNGSGSQGISWLYWKENDAGQRLWITAVPDARRVFTATLRIPNEDFVDEELLAKIEDRAAGSNPSEGERTVRTIRRNFIGADMAWVDLRRADLSDSQLSYAYFGNARLNGIRLERANMDHIYLDSAQMAGALLRDARIVEGSFRSTQLPDADLTGAKMQSAYLISSQFKHAKLKKADLTYAIIEVADFSDAKLQGALLQGAVISDSEFRGGSLGEIKLQGATLTDSRFNGTYMARAQLQGVIVEHVTFKSATLDGAELQGAALSDVNLQAASLRAAQLQGASLSDVDLRGASLDRLIVYRSERAGGELLTELASGTVEIGRLKIDNENIGRRLVALNEDDIKNWKKAATDYVRDEQRRKQISERLANLSSLSAARELSEEDLRLWRDVMLKLEASQLTDYATLIEELACDSYDAPYVARSLIYYGKIRGAGTNMGRVAEKMREGRAKASACEGTAAFTNDDWVFLDKLSAPVAVQSTVAPKPDGPSAPLSHEKKT